MSRIIRFFDRSETHTDVALDVIRATLGVALFLRGLFFITDSSRIIDLVSHSQMDWLMPALLLYAAILAHVVGGLMLALGLLTRIASLAQIPVLGGAVFFAFLQGGLFMPNQSLELSVLVLFLLGVLLVYGSGRYSLDHRFFASGLALRRQAEEDAAMDRHRDEIDEWDRIRGEAASAREGNSSLSLRSSGSSGVSMIQLVRYAVALVLAGSILYFGIRALPVEVSLAEIGAVGGILFVILAVFFVFFNWALSED